MASARSLVNTYPWSQRGQTELAAEMIRGMDALRAAPPNLRAAVVLRVAETWCQVRIGEQLKRARFAPQFTSPSSQRVSPGHLVALAEAPDHAEVVLWRWYDAVVIEHSDNGTVLVWEPAHGEVVGSARPHCPRLLPGCRAFASAGLPGAAWWVTDAVAARPETAVVELTEVAALYSDNDLWGAALGTTG